MGAIFLFAKDFEVTVSEGEAQRAIDSFLKKQNQIEKGIKVLPNHITIDFKADNKAHIKGDFNIEGLGYSGNFQGNFATGIDYRRPRLYLNNLDLIQGGFQADDKTESELSDLKKVATDILRRQRNDRDLDSSKSESLVDKFVIDATKAVVRAIPIYDVSEAGKMGSVASLALKDVKFNENSAVVVLSPVTALLRLLAILGSFCLFVMWTFIYIWGNLGFPKLARSKDKD